MFNTLDLDFNPKHQKDMEYYQNVILKILYRPCCKTLTVKPSTSKGLHVIIQCSKTDCDLCRFVFDDQERYRRDIQRKPYARNVTFQIKNEPINIRSVLDYRHKRGIKNDMFRKNKNRNRKRNKTIQKPQQY